MENKRPCLIKSYSDVSGIRNFILIKFDRYFSYVSVRIYPYITALFYLRNYFGHREFEI